MFIATSIYTTAEEYNLLLGDLSSGGSVYDDRFTQNFFAMTFESADKLDLILFIARDVWIFYRNIFYIYINLL